VGLGIVSPKSPEIPTALLAVAALLLAVAAGAVRLP